jgi:DNA-binding NtrC family response regulator
LRERLDDIPLLAHHLLTRLTAEYGKEIRAIDPAVIEAFERYEWPGNVRELQNCIERACILTEGDTIRPRHLNLSFRGGIAAEAPPDPWEQIDLAGTLADASRRVLIEVERRKIVRALKDAAGQKAKAADLLQVSYKTFLQKLKDYGVEG